MEYIDLVLWENNLSNEPIGYPDYIFVTLVQGYPGLYFFSNYTLLFFFFFFLSVVESQISMFNFVPVIIVLVHMFNYYQFLSTIIFLCQIDHADHSFD